KRSWQHSPQGRWPAARAVTLSVYMPGVMTGCFGLGRSGRRPLPLPLPGSLDVPFFIMKDAPIAQEGASLRCGDDLSERRGSVLPWHQDSTALSRFLFFDDKPQFVAHQRTLETVHDLLHRLRVVTTEWNSHPLPTWVIVIIEDETVRSRSSNG